jgi:hypothetical protein
VASTTPRLASLLFAVALVCANGPFLLTAVLPGVPATPRRFIPWVWAMLNEPSVDALSVTLTVSALVERDTPTTRLKMMMDDLEMNAGVTSWPSF